MADSGFTFLGQPTGTTSGTVATGNHHHAGEDVDSGTVAFARLPTGTSGSTVAVGNHAHAGADITSGTVAYARLPVGTTASTVAAGDHTHAADANQATIPADYSLIAWNMPIYAAAGSTVMATAGTLYLNRIRRVPAGTITNIVTLCTTQGSALTSGQCFAALYTAAGTLVAQTTNQSTPWGSTGVKTMALSSAQPVAAGDYYVGMWFNGTTGPTFARFANATGNVFLLNANLSAPNFVAATADTSITTTAPPSFGTQTASTSYWWVAVS